MPRALFQPHAPDFRPAAGRAKRRFFHAVENFFPHRGKFGRFFPHRGKLFSTLWKTGPAAFDRQAPATVRRQRKRERQDQLLAVFQPQSAACARAPGRARAGAGRFEIHGFQRAGFRPAAAEERLVVAPRRVEFLQRAGAGVLPEHQRRGTAPHHVEQHEGDQHDPDHRRDRLPQPFRHVAPHVRQYATNPRPANPKPRGTASPAPTGRASARPAHRRRRRRCRAGAAPARSAARARPAARGSSRRDPPRPAADASWTARCVPE